MSTLPDFQTAAIKRFLDLARRGRAPGASHGERVAHQLAKAIADIGDDFALLDQSAIDGAYLVICAASGPWDTAKQKEAVFKLINDAGR